MLSKCTFLLCILLYMHQVINKTFSPYLSRIFSLLFIHEVINKIFSQYFSLYFLSPVLCVHLS